MRLRENLGGGNEMNKPKGFVEWGEDKQDNEGFWARYKAGETDANWPFGDDDLAIIDQDED
jgi:hypothetical protein